MGTPDFAVPALEALYAQPDLFEVAAVVTQPDRPRGRGRQLAPSAVKACALAHNIQVLQPTRLKTAEARDALAAFEADLFIVAAYGRILPQAVLDLPALGCINIHASLLPKWRGASPIAHALWHGDAQAGVAIMRMEAGLDTGPVFGMQAVALAADETCGSLTTRLAVLGAQTLVALLPDIISGDKKPVAQDDAGTSYAPLLDKAHGQLDWRAPAEVLARQIRAFDPWPGTYTFVQDPTGGGPKRRVGVQQGRVDKAAQGPAGQVLKATSQGVLVACGTGGLWLLRVKPEGRGAMAAAAWVAGRGITSQDKFEVSLS